jgi:hypothetical protein
VYEGTLSGDVKSVPGELIIRVSAALEPDPACRSWVVLIHANVRPPLIPLLAIALNDPDPSVRMLTADKLGELALPIGLCYLAGQLDREFTDPADYQSLRAALADVTGFQDLPQGVTAVTQLAQVGPSREAWRRWWLSDASTAAKLKALEGMAAAGREEASRERHLIRFVMDPDYEVFRAAYRITRDAVAAGGDTPPQKKVFPKYPRLRDEEVTRAAMRSIQDRVAAWWEEFLAERRIYIEATGAARTPPGPSKDTPPR